MFRLPLAEFTDARNKLAARLKQSGRANDASLVKALGKPSISAWAANQLYWNHREAFDKLVAAGQRFRQVQMSGLAGKAAEMRAALEAKRESLTQLSDLATSLLLDSGHNPTTDILRRVTANLEALSAHASLPDGPSPGRLTQDIDPPGFASFGFSSPGNSEQTQERARATAPQKLSVAAKNLRQPPARTRDLREAEATRQKRIAAAKVSVRSAERLLIDARTRAKRLEAAEKKAKAEKVEAEKQTREAEKRFKSASLASEKAAQRARSLADELKEAAESVEEAKAALATTSSELESLLAVE
ncbi:MAG TPA: hypothetical protein VGO68_22355 [Pyrinomonadaceae bacterium]|nr:hypothetical protein [Pyrinomonadaceae bacterium]